MDKTFWNIMSVGGLVLGIGALMFAAKYMGEE